MKYKNSLLIALAAGVITGLIIYTVRKEKKKTMLRRISDEGYETAEDILYPDKRRSGKYGLA